MDELIDPPFSHCEGDQIDRESTKENTTHGLAPVRVITTSFESMPRFHAFVFPIEAVVALS
jgi:hypothetical protein